MFTRRTAPYAPEQNLCPNYAEVIIHFYDQTIPACIPCAERAQRVSRNHAKDCTIHPLNSREK